MKILALEFSSPQRSVAVVSASSLGRTSAPLFPGAFPSTLEIIDTAPRVTNAFSMIERALHEAQLEREQIDCIAVGLGPGSYTGIRAAIAVAQGWQLVRPTKLLGISTADCLAAQSHANALTGRIAVIIDAQRGEFYIAGYELDTAGWRETNPLKLAALNEVRQHEQTHELLVGPEVQRWFPAGRTVLPRATTLGQLALSRSDFVSGERLEPIYLRQTAFVKAPPSRILPT
jgi:tRNA threonylcarbamoyl adenosine modification protein YeaZ